MFRNDDLSEELDQVLTATGEQLEERYRLFYDAASVVDGLYRALFDASVVVTEIQRRESQATDMVEFVAMLSQAGYSPDDVIEDLEDINEQFVDLAANESALNLVLSPLGTVHDMRTLSAMKWNVSLMKIMPAMMQYLQGLHVRLEMDAALDSDYSPSEADSASYDYDSEDSEYDEYSVSSESPLSSSGEYNELSLHTISPRVSLASSRSGLFSRSLDASQSSANDSSLTRSSEWTEDEAAQLSLGYARSASYSS